MSSHHPADRVGPNAVTQLVSAAHELGLSGRLNQLFVASGESDWLHTTPSEMVEERRVGTLHQAIRSHFSRDDSRALLRRAGELTGAYILTHRIPKPAQKALRLLPRRLAAKALTKAIAAHAWTFVGSGRFFATAHEHVHCTIIKNPFCCGETASGPVCVWHEAVLSKLFQTLVSPKAYAHETACCANGDDACRFEIFLS